MCHPWWVRPPRDQIANLVCWSGKKSPIMTGGIVDPGPQDLCWSGQWTSEGRSSGNQVMGMASAFLRSARREFTRSGTRRQSALRDQLRWSEGRPKRLTEGSDRVLYRRTTFCIRLYSVSTWKSLQRVVSGLGEHCSVHEQSRVPHWSVFPPDSARSVHYCARIIRDIFLHLL
jgi:hypothetical protein